MTICASCWPTRSAPTIAGCGTPPPTRSWTRTVSAATWAAWSKPIAKSQGAWESCPNRCKARTKVPSSSNEFSAVKARVFVTLKNGVLDPQGKAIGHALNGLGFASVGEVRQGKVIDLDLSETDAAKARASLKEMCDKLLANTVIEKYEIELR